MPGSVPELRVIKRRFMGIVWEGHSSSDNCHPVRSRPIGMHIWLLSAARRVRAKELSSSH